MYISGVRWSIGYEAREETARVGDGGGQGTHVMWKEATVGEKKKVEAERGQDVREESARNLL